MMLQLNTEPFLVLKRKRWVLSSLDISALASFNSSTSTGSCRGICLSLITPYILQQQHKTSLAKGRLKNELAAASLYDVQCFSDNSVLFLGQTALKCREPEVFASLRIWKKKCESGM